MACCGHASRGIEIKREPKTTTTSKLSRARGLMPPTSTSVVRPRAAPDVRTNRTSVCPLCKSALRPISRRLGGKQQELLACIKCPYVRRP